MIKYIKKNKKNPKTGAAKFYAAIAPQTQVEYDKFIEDIENRCTLTKADIKGVLAALEQAIYYKLSEGASVRLGDLGSFRPTITAKGVDSAETVGAETIKAVNVRYTPSTWLIKQVNNAEKGLWVNAKADA